jgi:hypothetical protein
LEGGLMKKHVIGICPVCSGHLDVVKLKCGYCETEISGNFKLDKFSYLSPEEKYFIEVFVKNRGNIKEIEKELGVSYPTVKKNLDQVILALGGKAEEKTKKESILEALSKGELTSEEAMDKLKSL